MGPLSHSRNIPIRLIFAGSRAGKMNSKMSVEMDMKFANGYVYIAISFGGSNAWNTRLIIIGSSVKLRVCVVHRKPAVSVFARMPVGL